MSYAGKIEDLIAERDKLRQQVADLHACYGHSQQQFLDASKDAERYRWLRDVAGGGDWEHIGRTTDQTNTDARVDECMAAYRAVGAA